MNQLFSAYPAGLAGGALLLFRFALALFVATTASAVFALQYWPALLLDLLAVALAAGFSTRLVAAVLGVAGGIMLLRGGCAMPMLLSTQILDAAGLALIGPGAFSIDARLFGRATIRLPR